MKTLTILSFHRNSKSVKRATDQAFICTIMTKFRRVLTRLPRIQMDSHGKVAFKPTPPCPCHEAWQKLKVTSVLGVLTAHLLSITTGLGCD